MAGSLTRSPSRCHAVVATRASPPRTVRPQTAAFPTVPVPGGRRSPLPASPPALLPLLLALLVLGLAGLFLGGCAEQGPNATSAAQGRVIERGQASWYGPKFHGRHTASGEVYDMDGMTAAHKTLPFGTLLEVRNLDNGRSVRVRVNDRGPFIRGRIIDLSREAARQVGLIGPGVARVELVLLPSAAPEEPAGSWTVQVGAFESPSRAEALADRLRDEGLDARLASDDGWFRVQVGEFDRRAEAEAQLREVTRRGWTALLVAVR